MAELPLLDKLVCSLLFKVLWLL